ncbi:hypothetical protein DYBT9275_01767 [Dyadobacter sp. CECT 9275]|uniref:MerR family transcriptional regulator n=1 Tax=Dyadobacter helix TaxID=2822344 RepID=A0A916JEB0_9BACT|nr:chaperone modulator CbpM [Dyadobacter sp. CECT 9275]CAG4997402.1 hypothetical protein DYBT9275_01767 [Dyadobacter sp. CECT 9275]
MENNQLISADEFCEYYQVEYSLIESFSEIGLIETVIQQNTIFIQMDHLAKIERMIRLHSDLQINPEGIEAVQNLLGRIENMQKEIIYLRNRLRFFETDNFI